MPLQAKRKHDARRTALTMRATAVQFGVQQIKSLRKREPRTRVSAETQ